MANKEKKQAPITDEIATTSKDIDIFSGWLNRLENPDPTLRTEARGKGLKLYDEVDRDPHAGSVLQTRYLSVAGKEWGVSPAGDDDPSKKIADFVTESLESFNLTQVTQELLQGILYGFFAAEIMWTTRKGSWVPEKIIGKHPRRLSFTMERELRLLTPQNMIEGEPVPDRKFIVFTYGSSDNPYGQGLGQKLWWPVWFKKNGIKFWMVFLDKFGMPTGVGKYPPGTPKEQQQALLDAIDAIQKETAVKIPNTMAIELLEAARTGKVTYETLCEYMDKQMSKAVLGQTASTEGTPGKLGNEGSQEEVRQDVLKADSDLLSEIYNATLIRWIVDYNFSNVAEYPKFWIRTKEEGDLKPLAERDKIIAGDLRVPVGVNYFYETYGIPAPEKDEETVQGSASPQNPTASQFAESKTDLSPANTLDALGQKALKEINMDSMIDPVKKMLESSKSLADFRDRLNEIYADMPVDDFGNLMQKALTLADLSGRFDAKT
jgi:phage gp29-like protein